MSLSTSNILDRDVALKLLKEHYSENEEFVERFKRGAQSAAALSHPNIVSKLARERDSPWEGATRPVHLGRASGRGPGQRRMSSAWEEIGWQRWFCSIPYWGCGPG